MGNFSGFQDEKNGGHKADRDMFEMPDLMPQTTLN